MFHTCKIRQGVSLRIIRGKIILAPPMIAHEQITPNCLKRATMSGEPVSPLSNKDTVAISAATRRKLQTYNSCSVQAHTRHSYIYAANFTQRLRNEWRWPALTSASIYGLSHYWLKRLPRLEQSFPNFRRLQAHTCAWHSGMLLPDRAVERGMDSTYWADVAHQTTNFNNHRISTSHLKQRKGLLVGMTLSTGV